MAADLVQVLRQAGFKGPALQKAWAIAMRESGGNPQAFNGNASTGDKSYGLFQINMIGNLGPARLRQYGLTNEKQLLDPVTNARVAYEMSKGGTDFGAWGIGPNAYQGAPPVAHQRYQQLLGQFPGGGGSAMTQQVPARGGGANTKKFARAEALLNRDPTSPIPLPSLAPSLSTSAPPTTVPAPLLQQVMQANPAADPTQISHQLTDLYSRFGDWQHAVAALQSNPAVVSRAGGVPPIPEVQASVAQIMQGAGLPNAGAAPSQGSPTGNDSTPGLELSAPAPDDLAQRVQQLQKAFGRPGLPGVNQPHGLGELSRNVPNIPTLGHAIVQAASGYLGVPYKWGGTSRQGGMDCSGFIQNVFKDMGISLPRTTYEQVKVGQPVSLNHLHPGDVIFTEPGHAGPNHVGLYIGNGMVQNSPHTGAVNSTISLKDFLGGGFVAARRYTGLYQPKGGKK